MNPYVQLTSYCVAMIIAVSLIDVTTGSAEMVAIGAAMVAVGLMIHALITDRRGARY